MACRLFSSAKSLDHTRFWRVLRKVSLVVENMRVKILCRQIIISDKCAKCRFKVRVWKLAK